MTLHKHVDAEGFFAFLQDKLRELEDAAPLGDIVAAEKKETIRQILGPTRAPPPKPRPGRPTLVYSRKAPLG